MKITKKYKDIIETWFSPRRLMVQTGSRKRFYRIKIINGSASKVFYRKVGPAYIDDHCIKQWANGSGVSRIDGPADMTQERNVWFLKGEHFGRIEEKYWNK